MTEPDTQRVLRAAFAPPVTAAGALNESPPSPWVRMQLLAAGRNRNAPAVGLERAPRSAHIGRFKPLCDFNWSCRKSARSSAAGRCAG
jgi:hypothetical protein